jgi:hypothetical protein
MDNTLSLSEVPETPLVCQSRKRVYHKPQLQELGDLRTTTLSGSPGGGDSNAPGTQCDPGGACL